MVRLARAVGVAALVGLAALGGACDDSGTVAKCFPGTAGADKGAFPSSLSAYCMVTLQNGTVTANDGVTPYDLQTPLFSDYAVKYRTVWMPPGTSVSYVEGSRFEFPVGTVITKSFGFPADLRDTNAPVKWIETRVLVHRTTGWKGVSYRWDDAQQNATIEPGGEVLDFTFVNTNGTELSPHYLVPSQAECPKCHANNGSVITLGPWANQLNRDFTYPDGTKENELTHWSRIGILEGAPSPSQAPVLPSAFDPTTGDVASRARAYLQANCAYCHSEGGEARTTGLDLGYDETGSMQLGICKMPIAAGKAGEGQSYDIVPQHPESSILVYRMESTAPAIAMPEIGRSLEHFEAVELISDWINSMPATNCQ
ncbi:MAG TPA: SO2930 family diheme c-type cytochrome [Polyangiaceae bacterium]